VALVTAECTVAGVAAVLANRTADEPGQVTVMGSHTLPAAAAVKCSMSQQVAAAASFVMVDRDIGQHEQEMEDLQLSAAAHVLSHSMLLVARLQ